MYTAFYGLREKPFALAPDPRFLYLAASHREALAHLLYGIEEGEGFISVTGEVGTGKTTLCRTLLERLDGDTELAFLFNPSRTALELLQSICAELDLPAEGLPRRALMNQLDAFLVEQKQAGRRVLLIIDEAQTLTENTLEQVRLLSNLETSREKLIQILLLGQPELDRKLDDRALRQLRQRISVRWKLDPLGPAETRAYVRHRLSVAAGEPKDLFSESALREIHRRTGGIPRLVNQLCDRALLAGYAARAPQIGPRLVRAAAREIPDTRRPGEAPNERRGWMRPWMLLAASLGIVALALFAGLQVGRHGLGDTLGIEGWTRDATTEATREDSAPSGGAPPAVAANAAGAPLARDRPIARAIGFVSPEASGDAGTGDPGAPMGSMLDDVAAANLDHEPLPGRLVPTAEPEVTALSPGLLARLLATRDRSLALAESERAILQGFGRAVPAMTPVPRDIHRVRSALEARGLSATPFEGGSIELLRRLDHPVLLPVTASAAAEGGDTPISTDESVSTDADQRWLAITGFDGDRASLVGLLSGRVATVAVDELEDHWLETGIIVWERFDPVPDLLVRGEEGSGVLWLQRALAELRFYEGRPTGVFDSDTLVALTRFQRARGLVADGIAGPLTQIALYGQLERYPVPRLSGSGQAPARVGARGAAAARGVEQLRDVDYARDTATRREMRTGRDARAARDRETRRADVAAAREERG
jgi:general secretion pathway protein A